MDVHSNCNLAKVVINNPRAQCAIMQLWLPMVDCTTRSHKLSVIVCVPVGCYTWRLSAQIMSKMNYLCPKRGEKVDLLQRRRQIYFNLIIISGAREQCHASESRIMLMLWLLPALMVCGNLHHCNALYNYTYRGAANKSPGVFSDGAGAVTSARQILFSDTAGDSHK